MQDTGDYATCFCILSGLTGLSQELFMCRDSSNVSLGLPRACLAQTRVGGGGGGGGVLQ